MKKALLPLLLCTSVALAAPDTQTKSFSAKHLKTLDIEHAAGNLNISTSSDQKAHISYEKITFDEGCKLSIKPSAKKLKIKMKKMEQHQQAHCQVNFNIQVPKKVDVDVSMGSGDIAIQDTHGKLHMKLGNGDILVNAHVTDLETKLGNGTVNIKGLAGDAEVKVGNGDAILTYPKALEKADVDLKIGRGDATVFLPEGTLVSPEFFAGFGHIRNQLPTDSASEFEISMKVGMGSLLIKKL